MATPAANAGATGLPLAAFERTHDIGDPDGCARHRDRGSAVCPVTVYQSRDEVEAALIHQLQTYVFGEQALAMVVDQLRGEIQTQIPQRNADVAALEAELSTVRAEQKRLAKAVALADDVPELVTELQQRSARIQNLEGQLIAAKRTPAELAALVDRVEANVRGERRDPAPGAR